MESKSSSSSQGSGFGHADLWRSGHLHLDRHYHKCEHLSLSHEPNRWRVSHPPSDTTRACVVSSENGGHIVYHVRSVAGEAMPYIIKLKSGILFESDHTVTVRVIVETMLFLFSYHLHGAMKRSVSQCCS